MNKYRSFLLLVFTMRMRNSYSKYIILYVYFYILGKQAKYFSIVTNLIDTTRLLVVDSRSSNTWHLRLTGLWMPDITGHLHMCRLSTNIVLRINTIWTLYFYLFFGFLFVFFYLQQFVKFWAVVFLFLFSLKEDMSFLLFFCWIKNCNVP